jgi:hypothetical protein
VTRFIAAVMAVGVASASGNAAFVKFNQNFPGWQGAAGLYSTVTFGEIPAYTTVTNQYASIGLLFTSSDLDTTDPFDNITYPQDGYGLDGNCQVELTFSQPITAIGWHFPGTLSAKFYLGDLQVAADGFLGLAGQSNFVGFSGDLQFDRVELKKFPWNECGDIGIDNIYFSTIPAPGAAVGLVGLLMLRGRRRER